jgi:peptide deformylase
MAARTILELGNPLLWQRCTAVPDPTASSVKELAGDLADTLAHFREANGFGRGIAAPQIGALQRVLFVRMPAGGFTGPLINPAIAWESPERFELWDDCFSLPGLMVRLTRARRIRVEYQGPRAERLVLEAEDALSELLQHEIDHLDGVLATDRAASQRDLSTRDEWKRRHSA